MLILVILIGSKNLNAHDRGIYEIRPNCIFHNDDIRSCAETCKPYQVLFVYSFDHERLVFRSDLTKSVLKDNLLKSRILKHLMNEDNYYIISADEMARIFKSKL